MFTSPYAVALSGATALALVTLHAAVSYRRNTVSHQTYADINLLDPAKLLTTSGRLFEISKAVGLDEVSPDVIAAVTAELVHDLLNQATERAVALDWNSFRSHVFDQPDFGAAKVTVRVDVLS